MTVLGQSVACTRSPRRYKMPSCSSAAPAPTIGVVENASLPIRETVADLVRKRDEPSARAPN
jgi:hypothetical protein